jgi:hypothetical protein
MRNHNDAIDGTKMATIVFSRKTFDFLVLLAAYWKSFSSTETFGDHTGSFWSSFPWRTRFPYWFIKRNPEEPMIGSFVFATHTTVCSGTLWYQIPRYLLLELPRLKNPSAKIFPFEIRRSPSLMVWFVFKESQDVEDEKWRKEMVFRQVGDH